MSQFLLQPVEMFRIISLQQQFYKYTISERMRANLEQPEAG